MANVRKIFDHYKVQYTSSKRNLPLASIFAIAPRPRWACLNSWKRLESCATSSFISQVA